MPNRGFPVLPDDDEALLAVLRAVAVLEDPVPSDVTSFAMLAPSLISIDADLAPLLSEGDLVGAIGLRSDGGTSMVFGLDDDRLHLEVTPTLVVGELAGEGWSVDLVDESGSTPLDLDAEVFSFRPRSRRFALQFTRGTRCLATEWLRVG